MPDPDANWHQIETYKSMMSYGRGMLQFVFLANGGAIISILTFVGNLYAKGAPVPKLKLSLGLFIFGLLMGGVASITTYLVQFTLLREATEEVEPKGLSCHEVWFWLTFAAIIISIISFGTAAFIAVSKLG